VRAPNPRPPGPPVSGKLLFGARGKYFTFSANRALRTFEKF
jgi:hypothetical protein